MKQGDSSRERSELSGYGLLAMDRVGTSRKLAMDRVGPAGRGDRGSSGKASARGSRAAGRGDVNLDEKEGYAARAASPVSRGKRAMDKDRGGYAAAAASPVRKKPGDRSAGGRSGESSRTRDEFREFAAAMRKRDRRGVMGDDGGGNDGGREKGGGGRSGRDGYRDRDVSYPGSILSWSVIFHIFLCVCVCLLVLGLEPLITSIRYRIFEHSMSIYAMNFGEAEVRAQRTGLHSERTRLRLPAHCASPKRPPPLAGEGSPREAPQEARKIQLFGFISHQNWPTVIKASQSRRSKNVRG